MWLILVFSKEDAVFFLFLSFSPEINDGEGHPSSSHQALKGTSRWATSLENLLEDPEGVKRFRVDILNIKYGYLHLAKSRIYSRMSLSMKGAAVPAL